MRKCSICEKEMTEGYVFFGEDYACSDECADKVAQDEGFENYIAMHNHFAVENDDEEMESGEVYWTEWEEDEDDEDEEE